MHSDHPQDSIHPVKSDIAERAWLKKDDYEAMYERSISDNEGFWAEIGQRLDWIKPYTQIKDVSYQKEDLHIRWYHDGSLNACYNLSLIHI